MSDILNTEYTDENIRSAHSWQTQPNIATQHTILIGMLFVSFLIVSNLTAFKIIEIHLLNRFFINFPAALVFFPLTYFFDDIITEVYGFRVSRFIIWGGLTCSGLVILCTQMAVHLPASTLWDTNTHHGALAYTMVFQSSARTFIASMLAYFFGEFINSIILAKLKVITKGNYFSYRIMLSTILGVAIDSIIFCNIAFWYSMPHFMIWKIILTIFIFKVSYEFFMLPITYRVSRYLKEKDHIDYYDAHTKFNPFSLNLRE